MPVDVTNVPLKHRAGANAEFDAIGVYNHAVTTGLFYNHHCLMAKSGLSEEVWADHVFTTILPSYRREYRRSVANPKAVAAVAAEKLKQYYEEHVAEAYDDPVSQSVRTPKLNIEPGTPGRPDMPFIKRVREEVEAPTTALEHKMGNIAAGFCIGLVTGILLGGYIVFLIIAK